MYVALKILELLKRETDEDHPLRQKEIIELLKQRYPNDIEQFTAGKVSRRIKELCYMDPKILKCTSYNKGKDTDEKKNGEVSQRASYEQFTNIYYINSISNFEFKFLIDSIMSSCIFSTEKAKDLATRVQHLASKSLESLTKYVSGGYGNQKYLFEDDVLENVKTIQEAIDDYKSIHFSWNVYDVNNQGIYRRYIKDYEAIPLELIMHDGRYTLLLRFPHKEKVYNYNVDLMTNIEKIDQQKDEIKDDIFKVNFQQSVYNIKHPFNFGGEVRTYQLRVQRAYFSRLVNDFSYNIDIIKGTINEKTVDVKVEASSKGMMYWLLQHYDVATLLTKTDEYLNKELSQAVKQLYDCYYKEV